MNTRRITPTLVLLLALGGGACAGSGVDEAAPPSDPPEEVAATCSAGGARPDPGTVAAVPPAAAAMRADIRAAAARCDYLELERLALEGDGTFQYSYGQDSPAGGAAHWRELEAQGEPVLRTLVELLDRPPVRQTSSTSWPSTDPLGYRVGIDDDGDWEEFIAGD